MPKMRVLIAAQGEVRSALALALGVHRARPQVEVGGADTREGLFRALAGGTWQALAIAREFDGTAAEEIIQAASERIGSVALFVIDGTEGAESLAQRILQTPQLRSARPAAGPALPNCASFDEVLGLSPSRPRSGTLSCVLVRGAFVADVDRTVAESAAGGIACRWREGDILVLRRTPSPGEAMVWAETLLSHLDGASIGVTWFRGADLQELHINQADRAAHLAQARRCGLCTWTGVLALHHAQRIAGSAVSIEARRDRLLSALPLGAEQRVQLTSHSEEVAEAALNLARLLRLSPEHCERTRQAGLFHDLGKLVIPDDLLAKPGALSPLEKRVLNRHSAEGAWLCEALGLDPEVGRIVRHHHTRFDALEIAPDAARVVAVADAMVTMTSTRPYSPARTFEFALAELRRCRGTVFDPRVVVAAHILGASSMQVAA